MFLKLLELQMGDSNPNEASCRPAQAPRGTAESLPMRALRASDRSASLLGAKEQPFRSGTELPEP